MRGINKVVLVGVLGKDPESKSTNSGAVANISVATNQQWKDKQTGEKKQKTEWHRVVFFGRLAEVATEYLRKGAQVYIEGSLQTNKWQDKQGIDRYTTQIVARELLLIGGKQDTAEKPKQSSEPTPEFDDDIPF